MKKHIKKFIYICIIAVIFSFSACSESKNNELSLPTETTQIDSISTPFSVPAETFDSNSPSPTPVIDQYTEIVIGSVGDIMCHKLMLMDAQNAAENDWEFTVNGDESYSFDHWFQFVKPYTQYPDLMIGNLETTITLDNSQAAGYPSFATPKEILPSLSAAGFDVLLNGNNHILDKKQEGLISTIQALDEEEIYHTGAWASMESKNTPLVIDVKGIKVGIVSVTCSVNDQEVYLSEQEKEYMYIYTDDLADVADQINNCKNAGAELIVVCPHWGYEYETKPNAIIRKLGEEYIKLGADIILAHHPHVLQTVETLEVETENGETRQGLVYWSLGNFISNQMNELEYLSGTIAYVTVRKDNSTGEISIFSTSYVPIWTYIQYSRETNTKTYSILPVGQVLDNPELISKINPGNITYSLNSAWNLITKRIDVTVSQPLRLVPGGNDDTTY
ncbi:MAG: CapA family protein [Eubacteriales bacterium]